MFSHKLVWSLHLTALAVTLAAGLPAAAPIAIEPAVQASQTRGFADGVWAPATLAMPGSIHGQLVDSRGQPRFAIDGVTHVLVPSEIPGYDIGTLYGRLQSARIQGDGAPQDKGEPTKPVVDPVSIYVLGHWSVRQSDGAGQFAAVAYVEIEPLSLPLVLLDIGGAFQLSAKAPPSKATSAAQATKAADDALAVRFHARWMTRD
jgi:hypothetical protein